MAVDHPLSRRRLLRSSPLAVVPLSGCFGKGIGGQPEEIPFDIVNRSGQTETISVEFSEIDTEEVLLSETVELDADDTREFEVGPIDSQARYTVEYEIDGRTGDSSVSGSGLRSVDVRIEEDGAVEVTPTVS